jgi:GT2 family glycosyltransferase
VRLACVVPATDRPPSLGRCLEAITGAARPPDELVVVTEPPGSGPAGARNAGARRTAAEVIAFVDSDVLLHPDAFARIRAAFEADPDLGAVFGAYDDDPEPRDLVSRFRNLLHHHVHVTSSGPAESFWAGLGAVRADAFRAAGGFDADRYPRPAIEDIELGFRLHAAGARIRLDPALQGRHMRRWSLAGMVHTDLVRRGMPWVELLFERGYASPGLNLGWRHRLSALASVGLLVALAARRPRPALAAGAAVATLNAPFYRLLARRGGARLLAAGFPLHLVHQVTAAAAVPAGAARYALRGGTGAVR